MDSNYKYRWALGDFNAATPFSQMVEKGFTPEQVKEAFTNTLSPFFEDKTIINRFLDILLPDGIVVVTLNPWAVEMLNNCLDTHRKAKITDERASLEACVFWVECTEGAIKLCLTAYTEAMRRGSLNA